jgi:hypothetical protein
VSGVAIVVSFERVNDDDGHGIDVKCDVGGDTITVPNFSVPGIDAPPLEGDSVALSESHGSGAEQAVGYEDTRNAGSAAGGEIRLYARDADGAPMCTIWLRGDGRVQLSNENGSFEMAANGNVTINGAVIDADGNITTPGEVTAMDASPSTSVKLSTHVHGSGVGPTTAPTPGT